MKGIKGLILVMIFTLGTIVMAEDGPKITVSGVGRIFVTPDIATINIAVETKDKDVNAAKNENDKIVAKVVEALKKEGIDRKDYQTTSLDISSNRYNYYNTEEEVDEKYYVRNNLVITVRDLNKVGSVITATQGAGANSINGLKYSVTSIENRQVEALEKAYANAKTKATSLAMLEGYKIEVENIVSNSYSHRGEYVMALDSTGVNKSRTPIYAPTEIEVMGNITVTYKLVK